jgi:hypothetical protein
VSPHPSLNGGQIGFFTAIATVIPVLTLAYVVQGRTVAAALILRAHDRGRWRRLVEDDYVRAPSALATLVKALELLQSSQEGQTYRQYAWSLAVFVVVLVCVLFPAAGEISSLNALLSNHASYHQRELAWIGLITSGLVVIGPMIYSALGLDEMHRIMKIGRELRSVAGEFAAGRIDEPEWNRRLQALDQQAGWPASEWARSEILKLMDAHEPTSKGGAEGDEP